MGLIARISIISLIELVYQMSRMLLSVMCSRNKKVSPMAVQNKRTKLIINDNHALYQFSKYILEFVKASSIHGISFTIGSNRSRIEKLFWFIAVLASVGACSYLINNAKNQVELNPVSFGIDEHIWNVDDVS